MSRRRSILVAMSGGVDSSVVAALLKKRGHDVVGVTLQIWQESQKDPRHSGCCSLGAVEDARRVARLIGIPHYVLNYKDMFRETVIEDFISEYAAGRTPNPCVQCNRKVKFEALMNSLDELGCDVLATGHYARVRRDRNGRPWLMRARGLAKDQSYVLYMLSQQQLARVSFPLGELPDKAATRQIAKDLGLPVANKPDSQEICFVGEAGGYVEFLKKERPEVLEPGEMVDRTGKVIGEHSGVAGFTVGQRRGLGVASRDGRPMYVLRVDPATRRVQLGDSDDLLQSTVMLTRMHWGAGEPPQKPVRVMAKIRYNMDPRPARIYGGEQPRLLFDEPVRAVTPGQTCVAYAGMRVFAGGTID